MDDKAAQIATEAPLVVDPARDVMRPDTLPLDALFKPSPW
jgi:hypothetical protein